MRTNDPEKIAKLRAEGRCLDCEKVSDRPERRLCGVCLKKKRRRAKNGLFRKRMSRPGQSDEAMLLRIGMRGERPAWMGASVEAFEAGMLPLEELERRPNAPMTAGEAENAKAPRCSVEAFR